MRNPVDQGPTGRSRPVAIAMLGASFLFLAALLSCGTETPSPGSGSTSNLEIISPALASTLDDPAADANLRVKVAFLKAIGDPLRWLPIEPSDTLESGTQLHMRVEVDRKMFLLIIWEDAGRQATVLYPRRADQLVTKPPFPRIVTVLERMKLDDQTGKERVHVIATKEPPGKLKALLEERWQEDATPDPEWSKQLLTEVQVQKRDRKGLKVSRSRPTSIGGLLRGSEEETSEAIELVSDEFLYHRFTIDHR